VARPDGSTPRARCATLLGAFALAVASACGDGELPLHRVARGEAEVTGRGMLVLVVDGLRADHTSLPARGGGEPEYDRDTTPFLARLASEGAVFTDVWSPSPSLLGAHIALLAGSDPEVARPPRLAALEGDEGEARATTLDTWVVPDRLHLVARPFLARGWNTAAFIDHPGIAGLRGFDAGFREFIEYGGRRGAPEDEAHGVTGVGLRFIQWLNARELDEDWFAYVHIHDLSRQWREGLDPSLKAAVESATGDWVPRRSLNARPPIAIDGAALGGIPPGRAAPGTPRTVGQYELHYDRSVRALDMALERLVGHVDEFGRGERVTVVVVGSAGVEFGEHGLYLRAGLAAEEDLRVPMVVRPARALREELGFTPGPRDALVSSIDLAPTLVDLHGLPGLPRAHGVSLRPLLEAEGVGPGGAPQVRSRAFARASLGGGRAVVEPGWAYFELPAGADPDAVEGRVVARRADGRAVGEPAEVPGEAGARALGDLFDASVRAEQQRLHLGRDDGGVDDLREFVRMQTEPLGRALSAPLRAPR